MEVERLVPKRVSAVDNATAGGREELQFRNDTRLPEECHRGAVRLLIHGGDRKTAQLFAPPSGVGKRVFVPGGSGGRTRKWVARVTGVLAGGQLVESVSLNDAEEESGLDPILQRDGFEIATEVGVHDHHTIAGQSSGKVHA